MHLRALIAISNVWPRIGCHGNAPLSLVYRSATDEFPDGTDPISEQNSAWMCRLRLKFWPFLWYFWPILAKIWLPWQRALDPCNQKCLLWIGWLRKLPVMNNCILVISHTNAFICIYSYFSPKIGCHSDTPLSFVYGSVTDEFPDSANPVWTKLCTDMLHTTEVMAICVIFLPILAKNWLPWQRPLDPWNQKCLLWIGRPRKPPVISNHILVISRIDVHL